MSNEPLIELRDVSVDYGQFRALDSVSYRIMPGEIVCLLGGNACGKSTSMKAIFGQVKLATGRIFWKGERIDQRPTVDRVGMGIAAVPEGRRVFARMGVEENLLTGAGLRWRLGPLKEDLDRVYALFPRLKERRHQFAGTLSGGEQQMVAMGRALMSRPALICMDEPSMGLSPKLVRQSFELIETIHKAGTAVFVVEQNANAALKIADRAYVLQNGKIVLQGTADEVAADTTMREAYLGRAASAPGHAPEDLKVASG
ncbi:ABC transporter ATP-binding protein [Marinivivus vitaminiproducens]|uniref:ABC transporter ATP-binding protein n=1 Tax=Marinivivus vitaminiproducens TaxID=3035935 RepID=UPI00279DBBAB|nr:ABC transporter ATP-binding protein [Geminicoccaceae bacterium SCSIO 64248]